MSGSPSPGDGDRTRLETLLARLAPRRGERSPRAQRLLLLGALAVFVVSAVVAARSLDGVPLSDEWPLWTALAVVLAVGVLLVNAVEFAVTATLLGVRAGVPASLRVSVLSSAANVLPVPGSVLVRIDALRRLGPGARSALGATASVGLTWVAVGALLAGVLIVLQGGTGDLAVGGGLLAGGLAAGGLAFALLLTRPDQPPQDGAPHQPVPTPTTEAAAGPGEDGQSAEPTRRDVRRAVVDLGRLVRVEIASVAVGTARLWAVLAALDLDASVTAAAALTTAAILAGATGILPGGLGVREVLSAALAAVVGLPAAAGLLVSAVDRLLGYSVLAVASAAVIALPGGAATRSGTTL